MLSACLRRVFVATWSSLCSAVWRAVCGTLRVALSLPLADMAASVGICSVLLVLPLRLRLRNRPRPPVERRSFRPHRRPLPVLPLLLALLLWRMRPEHPNIIRGEFVRGKDLWLAIASLVMFILTFTPQPIVGPTLLDGLLQYFQ